MKKLDVTGQKYGRLLALNPSESVGKKTVWNFMCDCGTQKAVALDHVRSGRINSCGCLRNEVTAARSITHGHSVGRKESRELKSYNHTKSRCMNPRDKKYPQYGGRGISMCEEWLNDASKFIEDMGPCPSGMTIDRIDPNGNYEKLNCRWATTYQQARTRTDNVLVEYQGSTFVLMDYALLLGVSYKSLHARMRYKGQTLEQATQELMK
jgi:hypothetical protein